MRRRPLRLGRPWQERAGDELVVALPDGALASFASPENVLLPGELVPLAENVDLGEGFSVRLVDTVLDSSVPAGVYQLYAVAVPAGEALLNQDDWLAFEQLEFEIRPSD